MEKDLVTIQENAVMEMEGAPLGFEDEDQADMIIPRVKVVQTLSPERKDKLAEEGDIINSLTMEKLNGKVFIPVYKFGSNILWKPRSEGGGIECHAKDGKSATNSFGEVTLCSVCRKCEFDNSKTGKDALPSCTKYINFFGFFEGERMPVVLSFSKTNFKEGKKLYSLAKVSMQNMWHNGYKLDAKLMAKNGNEWYIIDVMANGATSKEDREFGMSLYKNFRNVDSLNYDLDESAAGGADIGKTTVNVDDAEF